MAWWKRNEGEERVPDWGLLLRGQFLAVDGIKLLRSEVANMAKTIKDLETAVEVEFGAIKDDLTTIADGVATQNKMIADLQSRLASGATVGDDEFAAVIAQGDAVKAAADAVAAALTPPVPAAAVPDPGTASGTDGGPTT